MNNQLKRYGIPFLITLVALILLEIMTSTLLPIFGLINYTIPINILIVLYLSFKLETPFLAIFILVIQYFHSFFTIEGWEMGTIAGILLCIIISYVREILDFSTAILTILVTQIFQVLWFLVEAGLIYMRTANTDFIYNKFLRFIPESLIISLLSPFLFAIFDRVWGVLGKGPLGEET